MTRARQLGNSSRSEQRTRCLIPGQLQTAQMANLKGQFTDTRILHSRPSSQRAGAQRIYFLYVSLRSRNKELALMLARLLSFSLHVTLSSTRLLEEQERLIKQSRQAIHANISIPSPSPPWPPPLLTYMRFMFVTSQHFHSGCFNNRLCWGGAAAISSIS